MRIFKSKWVTFYEGKDETYMKDLVSVFEQERIRYQATAYTAASRLANYAIVTPRPNASSKAPTPTMDGVAAKLLGNKSLDKYLVEVHYRDLERARQAEKYALGSSYFSRRAESAAD